MFVTLSLSSWFPPSTSCHQMLITSRSQLFVVCPDVFHYGFVKFYCTFCSKSFGVAILVYFYGQIKGDSKIMLLLPDSLQALFVL
jgi:hypothetical protein